MRRTIQRFAAVKPARYLEVGTATGLAGVRTHGSPRSTLLYLYSSILTKLSESGVPEHSAYRQSVEALTKHRMSIVEAAVPPGYDEWLKKAKERVIKNPEEFTPVSAKGRVDGRSTTAVLRDGSLFVVRKVPREKDQRLQEWDGELNEGPELEGTRSTEERAEQALLATRRPMDEKDKVQWEPEPLLTADQIEEIESKIGAGLIEEVIEVAEGELRLVDTMAQSKVWESLEEKPGEGQWIYFERKAA